VFDPFEGEFSPVNPDNRGFLDIIEPFPSRSLLNLILEYSMHRIIDRVLEFTHAEHPKLLLHPQMQQRASTAPTPSRTSPAPQHLKPLRRKQTLEWPSKANSR